MRVVPVLFPSDLGRSDRGRYVAGGERGAPDLLLDMLEGEGVRMARPVAVPVDPPEADDTEISTLKFDRAIARATEALARTVAEINGNADFPLVLGGDHTALLGHVLGHSRRHQNGIGLAVLADAYLDLASPAEPVFDDAARLRSDPAVTQTGNANHMVLTGCLRLLPKSSAIGELMTSSSVQARATSVAGVRGSRWAQIKQLEKSAAVEVWSMERLELDGEAAYRSLLNRHLAAGPIVLSIDVRGLDPDLMTAVRDPQFDGLDWTFLKRTLEQCIPHIDRLLGLDVCECYPMADDANKSAMSRFAEAVAPFLRRLSR